MNKNDPRLPSVAEGRSNPALPPAHLCAGDILQAGILQDGVFSWSVPGPDFLPSPAEQEALFAICRETLKKRGVSHLESFSLNGRDCALTVYAFPDARPALAVMLATDRSTAEECRIRLERNLSRSMELDAIVTATSDGIWVCDGQGFVTLVNPAAERVNNIVAEDVIGRNMHDLLKEGFIDRSAAVEVVRTGQPVSLLQMRDGRKLTSTGTPVFDANGVLQRVVVSTQDATEVDNLRRDLERQEFLADNYRSKLMELQDQLASDREIIARSPKMLSVLHQALKAGNSEASILLLGESGTGKGILAELIHNHSRRHDKPLLSLNCGAIPETLVEAELFGYEQGAFTGAKAGKPGLLEVADGGTLFLDEVAELPLQTQVKLLKFLDDGRFTRLGATKGKRVDVRVIAATNRDLRAMANEGSFRKDLYYRLNIIPIQIPPLRERKECIPALLNHFLTLYGNKYNSPKRLRGSALDALAAYPYPGNVRQLINICERLVVMTEHQLIDRDDLMNEVTTGRDYISFQSMRETNTTLKQAMGQLEKALLLEAYEQCHTQQQIAEALDISQASVARKLKQYGIGGKRPGGQPRPAKKADGLLQPRL